jgi:glyoxylase-like metal-dependent hydrolase (beta-lactamase superfamily II)
MHQKLLAKTSFTAKTSAIRLMVGLSALAVVFVAYTQDAQQARPPLNIEKVAPDLYNIAGNGGNVAAYVTAQGVILIDDKFEQDHDEIMAKVQSVTDKPIKYVLNTHQHGDHTGGNAKMLANSAEIIIQKNARANMVAGNMPGVPRISFTDETEVFLAGKEVRAHHFGRGHTNGDAAIYFPDLKVVHTGDLCVIGGSPFIDYSAGGSAADWVATIDKIMDWDFDIVIPGHGPVSKRADLLAFQNNFDKMTHRVTGMLRSGKGKDDVSQMLTAEFGWQANSLGMRQIDAMLVELK